MHSTTSCVPYSCRLVLLLAGLVLVVTACTPAGPERRPSVDAFDPQALFDAGRYAEAAQRWMAIADEQPGAADAARLSAAEAWLLADRPGQASELLDQVDLAGLGRDDRFRFDFARAELALALNDFETAARILAVPRDQVPEALRPRFDRLREALAETNPDSAEARVEALREAVAEPGFRPSVALALLIDLPVAVLADLREAHADDPALQPWLALAHSARSHLLDDPALRDALDEWQQQYPGDETLVPGVLEWLDAWRDTRPQPARIAVMLPGQGPLARAGEVLRDGMVAAWLTMPADRRPELDFQYLSDREDAAVGAWFEAREGGSDFVIGPLDRDQVASLVAQPDAGLPTLLLNRPPDGVEAPRPSQSLAMLALPPEEEAELAAVRALIEGHRRALVVSPNSDFGRRLTERFIATFELGGGRVVQQAEYAPGEFDYTDQLRVLLELDRSAARIASLSELLGESLTAEPHPRTDADLVFLAARNEARQIVPQLKFLEIGDVPMYATSHVLTRDLDRDLDGLQLPLSPWLLADSSLAPERALAEQAFPALQGSPTLSQLYALGQDAVALVPWVATMKGDPALYLAGRVGRLRLADGVALERDLPWAEIRDGRPVRRE